MINKYTRSVLLVMFAILTLSNSVRVKPITIFVADTIGSAKFAGEVVITGYDGMGRIQFKSTVFKDTLSTAYCRKKLTNGYTSPHLLHENCWTENYPYIGDTVFIVVNDRVSIFGKRVGNDYRLWSPASTGSIAAFVFAEPLRSIDASKDMGKHKNLDQCWDGCLMPIDQAQSVVLNYREKFKKKLAAFQFTKLIEQPAYTPFDNDTLRYYSNRIWNKGPHKKLISFTLTYSPGQSVEIYPVNKRNKPIRFDTTPPIDWAKFATLKIKQIRRRDLSN